MDLNTQTNVNSAKERCEFAAVEVVMTDGDIAEFYNGKLRDKHHLSSNEKRDELANYASGGALRKRPS